MLETIRISAAGYPSRLIRDVNISKKGLLYLHRILLSAVVVSQTGTL